MLDIYVDVHWSSFILLQTVMPKNWML